MPELPEVEITRQGLAARLPGHVVSRVIVRDPRLRQPIPANFAHYLVGNTLSGIDRRGKYLLLRFAGKHPGTLLAHLGMSGSLRVLPATTPPLKHDHVDIVFGDVALRFRDPRRFGLMLWLEDDGRNHPLLDALGLEPLSEGMTAEWLYAVTRQRSAAIKLVIMDSHTLVGVGNIYASESLFRAGIRPGTAANRLTRAQCARLVPAIQSTLRDALAAGGSTLRDFFDSNGAPGYFQQQYFVYDRAGLACRVCSTPIRQRRMGQRSTYYCPACQK